MSFSLARLSSPFPLQTPASQLTWLGHPAIVERIRTPVIGKKKTCLRLISYPDFTLSYFETSGYEKKHLIFNPFPLKITLITNSQNV